MAPPAGQDALAAEDHHEHEDEPEHHALVLRRLELRRQIGQRQIAQQRQPRQVITLKTADAVLILEHAMIAEGLK